MDEYNNSKKDSTIFHQLPWERFTLVSTDVSDASLINPATPTIMPGMTPTPAPSASSLPLLTTKAPAVSKLHIPIL